MDSSSQKPLYQNLILYKQKEFKNISFKNLTGILKKKYNI